MAIGRTIYFLLGDLVANLATGVMVAAVCAALIGPAWNMWLAMGVCMILGMGLALIPGFLLFYILFGAMEVMIPTMLTGMAVGMLIGMEAAMAPITLSIAAKVGAGLGVLLLGLTYAANFGLRRQGREAAADETGGQENSWTS